MSDATTAFDLAWRYGISGGNDRKRGMGRHCGRRKRVTAMGRTSPFRCEGWKVGAHLQFAMPSG
jgi:hypothetical protein